MDDNLVLQRLKQLKAQIADIDKRLAALDDLLANGETDEAIRRYAAELANIIEERETVLNEARQWLMLANKQTPPIDDGGACLN